MELFYCYAYGRLSKEDGDKIESDSIKNQRDLIHSYIGQHPELKLVMEGYDDGYTGTNFERPCFKEMLEAVKEQKVNCVIVKDLSRFGREYIEAGRYIEKLFPALGVRFIAINDGYDTAHLDASSSLILPFKNLINDSYCRDTSIKVRSHFDVKRRNGEFIGSFAAYGYSKDPENKNRLVVDPEAADVVREIFARRISGMSCQAIADELNTLGVPSPMEYKRSRGMKYKSGYRVHNKTRWSATAVRRILQNEVYLGVMEQGKRTTPNYKVKTVVYRPPEEWMRVEDTHEAIISREDFDLAARLMRTDTRTAPGKKAVHPFAGILCCGDCKGGMVRKTTYYDGKTYHYYGCITHRSDTAACSPHTISEAKLEQAVLEGVNLHIRTVIELNGALEAIARRPLQKVAAEKLDKRLEALRQELVTKQDIRDSLYRRYASGEVSRADFHEFTRIFTRECEEVERAIEAQQQELDRMLESSTPDSPWIQHFKQFGQLETLNREVLVRLVERILVYEGGRIEIVFRYQEQFANAMIFASEETARQPLREAV